MSQYSVDTSTEGLVDFVTKYNDFVAFFLSVNIDNQFVPSASGTVSEPSFAFFNDLDTGWYSPGANQVALSLGGTRKILFETTGVTVDVGISVSGNSSVDGNFDITGVLTADSGIQITAGGIDVTGLSTFDSTVTITAGGIDVTGDSSVDGNFDITSDLTAGTVVSDTSIDFSTTFAGINKERVVNSFSRTRQLYMASLG